MSTPDDHLSAADPEPDEALAADAVEASGDPVDVWAMTPAPDDDAPVVAEVSVVAEVVVAEDVPVVAEVTAVEDAAVVAEVTAVEEVAVVEDAAVVDAVPSGDEADVVGEVLWGDDALFGVEHDDIEESGVDREAAVLGGETPQIDVPETTLLDVPETMLPVPAPVPASASASEPTTLRREPEPRAKPGCLLVGLAGAVGALVGACVAGLILILALGGDDSDSAASPVTAAANAVDGSAQGDAAVADADAANGDGASGAIQDGAGDAAGDGSSSVAEAGDAESGSDAAADGNGAGLDATASGLSAGSDAGTRPLSSGSGEAGAPLGDRLSHINVRAVLEAVQEAVVIVGVETAEGDAGGSGFIVTEQGLIVTNAHVVADAETIEVRFFGGEQASAEAIAVDPTRDLAVLQVDMQNLPTVTLGSSAGVSVGDEVIAIGNAIGIIGEPTVTSGIVSGLDRSIELDDNTRLVRLIQTDAAINHGNSGGPLVNAAGEVIGVNTAIAGGLVEGIGFAISIDHALPIIDGLLEGVVHSRAYLGVRIVSVEDWLEDNPQDDADDGQGSAPDGGLGDDGPETVEPGPGDGALSRVELPEGVTQGALVLFVDPDRAASRAGIVPGDVVVKFNDIDIVTSSDLVNEILARVPGIRVTLTVIGADGSERAIEVKLGSIDPTDLEG